MTLASVHTLYETNCRSIPDMLRQSADSIETEVSEGFSPTTAMFAVQIAENGKLQIYGWGECDAPAALVMLERAKARLLDMLEPDE
jgi:hypothetical protein